MDWNKRKIETSYDETSYDDKADIVSGGVAVIATVVATVATLAALYSIRM